MGVSSRLFGTACAILLGSFWPRPRKTGTTMRTNSLLKVSALTSRTQNTLTRLRSSMRYMALTWQSLASHTCHLMVRTWRSVDDLRVGTVDKLHLYCDRGWRYLALLTPSRNVVL